MPRGTMLAGALLFIALGVAIGFTIGSIGRGDYKIVSGTAETEDHATGPLSARAEGPVPRNKPWNAIIAGHEQMPANPNPTDDLAVRTYRAEQARLVIKGMRSLAARSESPIFSTPLAASSEAWPYVEGWMSAIQTVAPEMLEDVGNEIESSLCDPPTTPTQQMLLVRMGDHDPLFVSQRGLTCTIARYTEGGEADHVLWKALEAWKDANLPVTPELEQLARNHGDERTLDLLGRIRGEITAEPEPMSLEEEARLEALVPPADELPTPESAEVPPRPNVPMLAPQPEG